MSDRGFVFEVVLKQRGRGWSWDVCTTEGALVMTGFGTSRPAASYEANRALFLLLSRAPYCSRPSDRAVRARQEGRGPRSTEL
jgi:hypothetical protein